MIRLIQISTIILLLLSAVPSRAGETLSEKLEGAQITQGASLSIESSYHTEAVQTPAADRTLFQQESYVLVSFRFPETGSSRPNGEAFVEFDLDYQVEVNDAFAVGSVTERKLALQLHDGPSTDVSYFRMRGASAASLTITDLDIPESWQGNVEVEISVHSDAFTPLGKQDIPASLTGQEDVENGNLDVSWNEVAAAAYYELEWTYVSNAAGDGGTLTPAQVNVDRALFRHNSSRVVVENNHYAIPLVYEAGIILYRVRAVGRNVANNEPVWVKSSWTAPDNLLGTVGDYNAEHYIAYEGHETLLNWQSSISFAEEGKHKVVVSYHDGSQRDRQAVTRINTDRRAIVGEKMYDYNGRPVMDVLPVPVRENNLGFYPHFNLIEGSNVMTKDLYETVSEGDGCAVTSPIFSSGTGAAQYYSPQNDFIAGDLTGDGDNLLNRDLIPASDGYPYTKTIYTPDNTGRVKKQSGAGENYRIGSGKETRYLYSTPLQPELTRLFGEQVGTSAHYKKETVIDPNGQTSVSYKNPEGKVVATALVGEPPQNVISLDEASDKVISAELIDHKNTANPIHNNRGRHLSHSFTVADDNTSYAFTYDAEVTSFTIDCYSPYVEEQQSFEVPAVMDVEFTLIDECGIEMFTSMHGSETFTEDFSISEEVNLDQGEYTIAKNMSINEDTLEKYWRAYVDKGEACVLTDDHFINEALENIDLAGCGLTCDECIAEIQVLRDELENNDLMLSPQREEELYEECALLCGDNMALDCVGGLRGMQGDMSPGGQYGKLRPDQVSRTAPDLTDEDGQPSLGDYGVEITSPGDDNNPDNNEVIPEMFPLSVFNDNNMLHMRLDNGNLENISPSWRHPVKVHSGSFDHPNFMNQILRTPYVAAGDVTFEETNYHTPSGDIFYVTVYEEEGGGYLPPVDHQRASDNGEFLSAEGQAGVYKVPVKYLLHVEDFENYWRPGWDNYLVPYHPEYGYFVECMSSESINKDHYSIIETNSIEDAKENGFLDDNGNQLLVGATPGGSNDAFFASDPDAHEMMLEIMQNFSEFDLEGGDNPAPLDMATFAKVIVNCPEGRNVDGEGCVPDDCGANNQLTTDEEWSVFKGLYMTEKQRLQRDHATRKAVDDLYYNGCIGQPDFLTDRYDSYFFRPIVTQSTKLVTRRECTRSWGNLFGIFQHCQEVTEQITVSEVAYPRFNPSQTCNWNNAYLYAEKDKRFHPMMPSGSPGGMPSSLCYRPLENEDNEYAQVEVPCPDDNSLLENMEATKLEAKRYTFESCGLCPLAAELENMISALHLEGMLLADEHHINCFASSNPVKLGTEIEDLVHSLMGTGKPALYYSGEYSNGNTVYTGTIGDKDQTDHVTVTLAISNPGEVEFTLEEISRFCCMKVATVEEGSVYDFSLTGVVDNAEGPDVRINLQGTFSQPLAPCAIPPKCLTTAGASRVALFLNTLAMEDDEGFDFLGDMQNDLITDDIEIDLPGGGGEVRNRLYTTAVRFLLGKNDRNSVDGYEEDMTVYNPTWKSNAGTTPEGIPYIEGNFSYTDGSQVITIYGLNTMQAEDLIEFVNLRPLPSDELDDECDTQNCTQGTFRATALIQHDDGTRSRETVRIYAPGFLPVQCRAAKAPAIASGHGGEE